jgi:transcriptional antiterminator NusG
MKKKWYVLKTLTGYENKVKYYIENNTKNFDYKDYIGRVIVPVEKIIQIKNGKRIQKEKAYYNGYVMIELRLYAEVIFFIKNIPGVINFLCEGKKGSPLPMRSYEVNKMLGKITEDAFNNNIINIPFILGESVKVIDGPFNGFNGVIEKINEEKKKVELSVLIFGRKTPLELNFTQIEKF